GDVIYVELYTNPDGKPKGSGVVEFRDLDTAGLAIEKMHRYEINGRKLVVREERDRDRRDMLPPPRENRGRDGPGVMGPGPRNMGGPVMGAGMGGMGGGGGGMGANMNQGISPAILQQLGIEGPPTNTVFVSNLDYKVGWKKLKDVFKLAGNVTHAKIMEDKDAKSRGMGTVTFETPMEAVQAISMFNNQSLYDRTMRVKMDGQGSSRQEPLPAGLKSLGPSLQQIGGGGMSDLGGNMGSGLGMGMGMGGMSGGMGTMDRMSSGLSGMGSMTGMGSGLAGMGSSLSGGLSGLGSMGSGMSSMGMGDTFGGMSGMGGMGSMGSGGMGASSLNDGFGMSSMGSSGMGATSGFSSMMDGNRSSGMGSYGSSSGLTSRMDSSRMNTGSSSMPSHAGDMKTRADRSTVIVKNLPYSLDWQTLKSKFQGVGEIRFAEISKNDRGRSNGWGLVSFRNEEDAQLAVQRMNRVNIDGRDIVVKLLN
ncbi:hypothetical protein DPMN_109978, partial [Dreissena polymorpha]